MNGTEQLGLKDITFLRAIRDINGSPERYASTEQGVSSATVAAITAATTLSEEEVTHRLDHPELGRSDLVKVYEAEPSGDGSAGLDSAELTEAGERAIAEADARIDDTGRQRDVDRTEFDEMQEWEPADGEGGDTPTQSSAEPTAAPGTGRRRRPAADAQPTDEPDDDRLAALESRIEQLEAERGDSEQAATEAASPERVDDLAAEVASLRESTDRLAERLDDALETLEAIEGSEYGAIDEKRERQFETAVKSMVAFHQLATEVFDVRVENYEPAAGRAGPERVATTRDRIGDALGIAEQGGGASDITLDSGDSDWPDPEEAAKRGRGVPEDHGGSLDDDGLAVEGDAEPELASKAPDTGDYPPIGGNKDDDEAAAEQTDAEAAAADEAAEADMESEAPDTGVYPPIGGNREEETDGDQAAEDEDSTANDESDSAVPNAGVYPPIDGSEDDDAGDDPDGSLPASMRPGRPDDSGIAEPEAEETNVVDPIRNTDDSVEPRLDVDADGLDAVRTAVSEHRAAADDPYPAGEAYARIVGEAPVGDDPATAGDPSADTEADAALDDDH